MTHLKTLWRKYVPLRMRRVIHRWRQLYPDYLSLPQIRPQSRKKNQLSIFTSTHINRIANGTERYLATLYIKQLEESDCESVKEKVSAWFIWHTLTVCSRVLYSSNKLFPTLFSWTKNEKPIPFYFDGFHFTVGLFLIFPSLRAKYFDSVSSGFFSNGVPEKALKYAQLSGKIEPNPERHDAVLRCLLVVAGTQQEFYDESVKWSELYENKLTFFPAENLNHAPNRPLRVGLLCDYLNSVIGRFTLQPQILEHQPENLRFFVYNFGGPSYITRKICPQVRDVGDLTNDAIAEWIRQDGIDVLIEMNGRLRPNHKFDLLTKRPAPIQVSWYNLPATSGMKCIDYVIADEFSVPEGQDKFYTERVVRLEGGATGGWDLPEHPEVAHLPANQTKVITFGCFGDMFKYNADLLNTWAEILRCVPQSRLYLKNAQLDMPLVKATIAKQMAARGIFPDRLVLEGMSPFEKMRELYGQVDIALDTFPFSSGSTSINALWQGVPVVCIAGPDWRGRSTSSIVASAGLTDFIADSSADYVEKTIAAAQNLEVLSELRATMRERLKEQTTYFRMDRYTQDFEGAINKMWETYLIENGLLVNNAIKDREL